MMERHPSVTTPISLSFNCRLSFTSRDDDVCIQRHSTYTRNAERGEKKIVDIGYRKIATSTFLAGVARFN